MVSAALQDAYPFPAAVVGSAVSGTANGVERKDERDKVTDEPSTNEPSTDAGDAPLAPILWANERWTAATGGRDLAHSVHPWTLIAFQQWLTAGTGVFTLCIEDDGECGSVSQVLHLAKTETRAATVLTSIILDTPQRPPPATVKNRPVIKNAQPRHDRPSTLLSAEGRRPTRHKPSDNFTRFDLNVDMKEEAIEFEQLVETTDWSKTALGPYAGWPQAIKAALSIAFASATQDSIWFGPIDNIHVIYNHTYSALLDKHPQTFGQPAEEVWPLLWGQLKPLALRCLQGDSVFHSNDLLLYQRNDRGHFVEKYHTWSYVPIRDETGIVGLYNMSLDMTEKVLLERRSETARRLVETVPFVYTKRRFFEVLVDVLEENPMDVPFAICYSVHQDGDKDTTLILESTLGVPDCHQCAPSTIKVALPATGPALRSGSSDGDTGERRFSYQTSYDRTAWPIARALATRQCVVVDDCSELIAGLPVRQWEQLPDAAIVVPIASPGAGPAHPPRAVLILGLNIHATFDTAYLDWIQLLRGHLVTAYNSVLAFEGEVAQRLEREKLERAKTAWFRGAAHEFRTPLTLIAGPLEDALDSVQGPHPQRTAIMQAYRNVKRLQRLVTTLLDFTRIEAGRLTPSFAPLDLGQFVIDISLLFQPAAERLGIRFELDIEESEGVVCFDPVLLEMALSNLLSNSLKYTDAGSLSVKLTYGDSFADVSITDTGVGIPADEVDRVTDMYHRTPDAVQSDTVGSGIGLSLAKEIVRLHGGDLIIRSDTAGPSRGSTFTARILTKQAVTSSGDPVAFGTYGRESVKEAVLNRNASPASVDSEAMSSVGVRALSDVLMFEQTDVVLIVDDNAELRQYIKGIFDPFCTVLEAKDGAAALDIVRRRTVHLILSDMLMPRMTGLEMLKAIRADHDRARSLTPVILLSAVNDSDTRLEALVAGAEEYISKPFKRHELLARAHLHLQMGKKRATLEKLFLEREEELKVLSDYCPSGILRMDAAGRITYANDAFREASGMSSAAVDMSSLWNMLCDDETVRRLTRVWREIIYGESATMDVAWKWKSTGRSMSGVFIRLDKVRPGMSGIIGCVTDISYQEERLLEAERRRLMAEESRRQQEMLVDFTSHEIRTPVSAILQCSSLAKENLVAHRQELATPGFRATPELLKQIDDDIDALESIYQCGLLQERIAGDVLSLARIQLDMFDIVDVPVDIRREAQRAMALFQREAATNQIELELEFGDSLGSFPAVKTDPHRLGQVVSNLIANAIRFTSSAKERRVTMSVNVSPDPPDNGCLPPPGNSRPVPLDTAVYLYISVRDTGPGMPPDEQCVLFQRFHQGNKMVHTRYGGSGLGLFICKKITELLGGGIEVDSAPGVGSEFRFFIKVLSASPDTVEREKSLSPVVPCVKQIPLHILIVEDNPINQKVLKRQILKAGLTCATADNGQQALDAVFSDDRFDVILMDLEMPVMDGLTALGHIRDAEADGRIPRQVVIALTGNARDGQIEEARRRGMDDVVIKPYKVGTLLEKLQEAAIKELSV